MNLWPKRMVFLAAALVLLAGGWICWYLTPVSFTGTLTVTSEQAENRAEEVFLDVQFHLSFSQYTVTTGRMHFRGSWYTAYEEQPSNPSEKQFAENFSDYLLVHSFFREEDARQPDQVTVSFSRVQSSGLSTALLVQSSVKSGVPEFFTWETGIFQ